MKGLQSTASAGRNTYYNDSFVNTTFDGVVCQVRPVAIKQEDYWLFQSSHARHRVLTNSKPINKSSKSIFKNCYSYTYLVCNCTQCFLVHSDTMFHTNVVSYTQQEVENIHQKQNHIQAQCTWLSCWSEQMAFLNSYCNAFHYSYCNTFPINYHVQLVSLLITSN